MMGVLGSVLLVLQLVAALGVIVLVLLQHGKGADMGAAFGSGASGSLFGATGSANFLSRATAVLATVFFVCTLGLAMLGGKARVNPVGGVMSTVPESTAVTAPATTAPSVPAEPAKSSEIPK